MKKKSFIRGDIHLIPFPFTDLSGCKLRPAVILGVDKEDITVAFITSVVPKGSLHLPVSPTKENGIKTSSYIRYTKLATLDRKLSVGVLGILSDSEYKKLTVSLNDFVCG